MGSTKERQRLTEATKERQRLTEACTNLSEALIIDDPQKMAESIALMHESMREFIETGYVSYEAIDCELIKLEKEKRMEGLVPKFQKFMKHHD